MRPIMVLILFPLMLSPASAGPAVPPGNLVVNGDFQTDADGDGWPDGWPKQAGVSVVREGGNVWIQIDRYASIGQRIPIDPSWWKLRVSMRMRVTGVTLGDEGWKDARLAMNFVDERGQHVDPWPPVFHAEGTTGWLEYSGEFTIPEGARMLYLDPSMFGASGRAEFDDVSVTVSRLRSQAKEDLPPPEGTRNLWNMETAWRQTSSTRERICLNDLWRFLPVTDEAGESVPGANQAWGWFKVPGIWPRSASGEAQEVFLSDWIEERANLANLTQAWYRRDITVPASWRGRRVFLDFTLLQTHARVYLDGEAAGEAWFPGGRLEITEKVRFGEKQSLAMLVTARPFERESRVFMAPDRVVTSDARVERRGITGDLFLVGEPVAGTIEDVHVICSVRQRRITLDAGLRLSGAGPFRLSATVLEAGRPVKRFQSALFRASDLRAPQGPGAPATATPNTGRFAFGDSWANPKLWDLDTPGNMYDVVVSLHDAAGKVMDESFPERFGFREFRIRGRDFLLNEKPVHLRALHLTNLNAGADRASVEGSRVTLRRMQEYGFNFFITGNYHFKPGA
ncbi:MAG: hypothetical protein QHJ73_07705, partial [Armatimonadota bacterium]|nr:hypothetical protein [Armatimonadota bacterium]